MEDVRKLMARLEEAAPGLELRENEPMCRHTSFQVGGPAALMALPRTAEEAERLLAVAAQSGVRPFFMGRGTNLLVADGGVDALVVKTCGGLDRLELEADGRTVAADSGVTLARLAGFALEHGLTGLEFAQGIPGSVGGGVYMNAGAYGGELSQVAAGVTSLGLPPEGAARERRDPGFAYRRSVYQETGEFILRARFTLEPGDRAQIRGRMEDLAARRRAKQPLEWPSAGSTFKRPPGRFAAALIEECGLKGMRVGGAQVSEKHAGFVINRGDATCADILGLIELVQERVMARTGVALEPEVRMLGV